MPPTLLGVRWTAAAIQTTSSPTVLPTRRPRWPARAPPHQALTVLDQAGPRLTQADTVWIRPAMAPSCSIAAAEGLRHPAARAGEGGSDAGSGDLERAGRGGRHRRHQVPLRAGRGAAEGLA